LDPRFVDPLNDDFHLQATSPCRNSGRYSDDRGALPYIPTGIADQELMPSEFLLLTNYPNPFNAGTAIEYAVPVSADVNLEIFSITGEKVTVLYSGFQESGIHSITWNAHDLSSGIYFCKVTIGEIAQTRKMILTK
jgi:hypothetical protein